MELLQLRYFLTAAKYEHMTKAAAELNISQPALSKMIGRLEDELGAPLFHRQGKQIYLNEFGKAFQERVKRIFLEINEGILQVQELNSPEKGIISIAMTLPHIMAKFLGDFLKDHPQVKIKHKQASISEMKYLLENAEVDLCISTSPIIGDYIEWVPLREEEIFLSIPADHRLAKHKTIDLREVSNERFINLPKGYGFRDITDKFCKEVGFTPNVAIEVEESWAIQQLVELGHGISFIPNLSILRNPTTNTARIKISHPTGCKRVIGISWNKNHYLSKSAINFREFCIDFFKHKVKDYYYLD
ncbi:LysR family transcriptional regulator [Bacillus benzoevorans]|uniref:DNA-binding transcriptional LysR family regulator n=1 Tax=Bacillus benzoevorans TaxID=1456 RepID=A0A7X0HSV5_9BACI|nr:LysR family transcriptional regulator [Bacillus benzoevorans]MBB6446208.1 DNA-binding transcriptional LysR family regulator [Bacillus benzoevorans]